MQFDMQRATTSEPPKCPGCGNPVDLRGSFITDTRGNPYHLSCDVEEPEQVSSHATGSTPADAIAALDREQFVLDSRRRHRGKRNIIFGLLWFFGGVAVTAITYANASNSPRGGTYLICWGAIIGGLFQLFRGVSEA